MRQTASIEEIGHVRQARWRTKVKCWREWNALRISATSPGQARKKPGGAGDCVASPGCRAKRGRGRAPLAWQTTKTDRLPYRTSLHSRKNESVDRLGALGVAVPGDRQRPTVRRHTAPVIAMRFIAAGQL